MPCNTLLKLKKIIFSAVTSFTELEVSSQKKIRLVKQNLAVVNPCWLFPITLNLNMASSSAVPGNFLLAF